MPRPFVVQIGLPVGLLLQAEGADQAPEQAGLGGELLTGGGALLAGGGVGLDHGGNLVDALGDLGDGGGLAQ